MVRESLTDVVCKTKHITVLNESVLNEQYY